DGGGAAVAEADGGGDAGVGARPVRRPGGGAHGHLQLAGPALGHRPVPARGGPVPRGGADRGPPVAEAPAAREGAVADDGRGAVLLRGDPGPALAGAGGGG